MNERTENHNTPYSGQCLCGRIRYEVDAIGSRMGHCHCSMCRKFHGAAFATLGEASAEQFRWTAGEEHLKFYVAPNGTKRGFCAQCGSSLTFAAADDDGELVEFALGTLDTPIDLKPDAHIFTAFGANWYVPDDDLPTFPEGRDSGQA